MLAGLVAQRDQPPQGDGDLVGLPDIQREGGPVEALAEQLPAQERRGIAGLRTARSWRRASCLISQSLLGIVNVEIDKEAG
jgi:hypothetical protein